MIPHVNDSKEELVDEYDYEYEKDEVKWYHAILLNRPLKVVIVFALLSIMAPFLIYQFMFSTNKEFPPVDGYSRGSCLVSRSQRLPCGVGHNMTKEECNPECCYDLLSQVCFHRVPSRFSYVTDKTDSKEWSEETLFRSRIKNIPYASQKAVESMRLSVDEISSTHLSITYYDASTLSLNGSRIKEKNYTYDITVPELNVEVISFDRTVFSTVRGPLIASENIWEIAFKLTNESMYGFGELPLKEGITKVIHNRRGDLTSIPIIFAKVNGSYHGLLIDMKTPTEIMFLTDNRIVLRNILGEGLKFHVFVGPKPQDVMRDVMKLLGFENGLEYWMLGVHVCSEPLPTLTNAQKYTALNTFVTSSNRANFRFESHCGLFPVELNTVCSTVELTQFRQGATLLANNRKKFVPHVSPFVHLQKPAENSTSQDLVTTSTNCPNVTKYEDLILRDPTTSDIYFGSENDKDVFYPNYENATQEFMQIVYKYNAVNIHGVYLMNNWPLDETLKNYENATLPYFSENLKQAIKETPRMDVLHPDGEAYINNHNKYGDHFENAFTKVFNFDFPSWRSSQWMSGDARIIRQDVDASWTNLHKELIGVALSGISGHWFTASPICGDTNIFDNTTQTELCLKWYFAGTYFPMINIHSTPTTLRHPLAFTGTYQNHMIRAMDVRLHHLPYYFTTLQKGPLLRPMFYQYPSVEALANVNTQFNVGDDLVIVPNLHPEQTRVHIWMPPGTWYELGSGVKLKGVEGQALSFTTTEHDFLTLIRGGSILVTQKNIQRSIEETRLLSQYSLTIALECNTSASDIIGESKTVCHAEGNLFISSNMTLTFKADDRNLTVTAQGDDYDTFCKTSEAIAAKVVGLLHIYGLDDELNNNDNFKSLQTTLDLCGLETSDKIDISFV